MKPAMLLLLLFCACRAPDGWSLSPYYGRGHGSFDRSFAGLDTEEGGLMVSFHWYSTSQREAYRNLAALDVSKSGQLTMRDDHHSAAPVIVQVEGDEADEAPPPLTSLLDKITEKPKAGEELNYLVWIFGLCAAVYVLHLAGVLKKKP